MIAEYVDKLDYSELQKRYINLVKNKGLNINQSLLDKLLTYFKTDHTPVVEINVSSEESLLSEEDKEDILHVIDPLLARAKKETPVAKAKPKLSYLTALFYANVYKNYHEKKLIDIAINRYKWIKTTIEENNQEIINAVKKVEELKNENEKFKNKNNRILIGYNEEQIKKIKIEIEKYNKLPKAPTS